MHSKQLSGCVVCVCVSFFFRRLFCYYGNKGPYDLQLNALEGVCINRPGCKSYPRYIENSPYVAWWLVLVSLYNTVHRPSFTYICFASVFQPLPTNDGWMRNLKQSAPDCKLNICHNLIVIWWWRWWCSKYGTEWALTVWLRLHFHVNIHRLKKIYFDFWRQYSSQTERFEPVSALSVSTCWLLIFPTSSKGSKKREENNSWARRSQFVSMYIEMCLNPLELLPVTSLLNGTLWVKCIKG